MNEALNGPVRADRFEGYQHPAPRGCARMQRGSVKMQWGSEGHGLKSANPVFAWANEAPKTDEMSEVMASNEFRLMQKDSLLIPFGDYDHPNGLQRFDQEAANSIVADLETARGKMMTRFVGLPIYIGHPDDPSAEQGRYTDKASYGRITAANATPEGLLLKVKWGNTGRDLVEDGKYAFYSPFWGMKKIGRERGRIVARPVRLYSVGLTNDPVIPVNPIANERGAKHALGKRADNEEATMNREQLIKLYGLSESATDEEIIAAANAVRAERDQLKSDLAAANERVQNAESATAQMKKDRDAAVENAANERTAQMGLLIDSAIAGGKIIAGDREKWANEFSTDFNATKEKLDKLEPLKTGADTANLGERNQAEEANPHDEFTKAVNERQTKTGEAWDVAWANTKRTRKDLVQKMEEHDKSRNNEQK